MNKLKNMIQSSMKSILKFKHNEVEKYGSPENAWKNTYKECVDEDNEWKVCVMCGMDHYEKFCYCCRLDYESNFVDINQHIGDLFKQVNMLKYDDLIGCNFITLKFHLCELFQALQRIAPSADHGHLRLYHELYSRYKPCLSHDRYRRL